MALALFESSPKGDEDALMKQLPDPPKDYNVEAEVANELNRLNYKERAKLEEEIHGVGCQATEESPELIEQSLLSFDTQLNDFKESEGIEKHPYLRNVVRTSVEGEHPCYVNHPDVRIRFLRRDLFDVGRAVQRFVDFLDLTNDLFGAFVADRPIRRSDFTKEEESKLVTSRAQYLPFRDRSGRRVFITAGHCNFVLPVYLRYKMCIYMHWEASADPETQRRGQTNITYIYDESEELSWQKILRPAMKGDIKHYRKRYDLANPVRVVSHQHYYKDTPFFRFLAGMHVYTAFKGGLKKLVKIHFGEQTEVLYQMASYGVAADLVPISSSGAIKFNHHTSWLNVCRVMNDPKELQSLGKDYQIVECPRPSDVVFRSGVTARNNPGNNYYRELIEEYSLGHLDGDKSMKYEITMLVVQKIEEKNGRFLEWLPKRNMWVVFEDRDKVRKKIAAAFKQYNRTRGERQKMKRSIEAAASIASPENNTLKEYYFMEHPKKRRKDSGDSNECFGADCSFNECVFFTSPNDPNSTANVFNDDGGSCFGRSFFPIPGEA